MILSTNNQLKLLKILGNVGWCSIYPRSDLGIILRIAARSQLNLMLNLHCQLADLAMTLSIANEAGFLSAYDFYYIVEHRSNWNMLPTFFWRLLPHQIQRLELHAPIFPGDAQPVNACHSKSAAFKRANYHEQTRWKKSCIDYWRQLNNLLKPANARSRAIPCTQIGRASCRERVSSPV